MTDDVVLVGAVGPAVSGLDAVRRLFSTTKLPWKYTVEDLPVDSAVEVLGDTAMVSNGFAVIKPENDALPLPTLTVSGRTIAVFRRQIKSWKLARLISLMDKVKS